jgi:RHS repeat-associated protein
VSSTRNVAHTWCEKASPSKDLVIHPRYRSTPSNPFTAIPATGFTYTPGGAGNQAPHAVAAATPSSGTAPLAVNFNATSSTDPDSNPLTYAWDLDGDGQYDDSTSPTPSWNYTTTGTKTATLQISDGQGGTDTDQIVITVTSGSTTTTRYGYTAPGDSAALIQDSAGAILGKTFSLPGGVLLQKNTTGDRWSAANIHGDVMALTNATGVKQGGTFTWDPYGQPLAGQPDITPGVLDYGWVGGHQRLTETGVTPNYVEMGVRVYLPALGRFLQQDPVQGGSANDFEYALGDPINTWDLDGRGIWDDAVRWVGEKIKIFGVDNVHLVIRDNKPGFHWGNHANRIEYDDYSRWHYNSPDGGHHSVWRGVGAAVRDGARSAWAGVIWFSSRLVTVPIIPYGVIKPYVSPTRLIA